MRSLAALMLPALLLVLGPVACEQREKTAEPTPVRAVKTVVVAAGGAVQERTLSGLLVAAETTRLSFSVGGKLLEVPLREGERMTAGQVVARIDPVDIEREIAGATAHTAAARGRLDLADREMQRQQSLFDRGFAARAAFDRAKAQVTTARSELHVAEGDLKGARDRLARTVLAAPRAAVLTKLLAKQFEEIAPGTPIYEISATGSLEAEVLVPEQLVGAIQYDTPVQVSLPTIGARIDARVSEIAAEAGVGNAFRVKARLEQVPPGARNGLTAAVTFELDRNRREGIDLPLAALAFETTRSEPTAGDRAIVYVFDPGKGTVDRRSIRVQGVTGNQVSVAEGLAPGERVVVAGVAFLRDGQRARLWTPPE